MKKFAIGLVVVAAATTPAFAQSDKNGTGPRAEVHLGWDSVAVADQTGNTTAQSPKSRLLYGAGLGYDVGLGHGLIAGVETNLDLGGQTRCTDTLSAANDVLCGKAVRDWDIGARLGMKAGPALVYGRVAYDNSLIRSTYLDGAGGEQVASRSADGVRLGAGVEVPVAHAAYVKAEYRYTFLDGNPDKNQLLAGVGVRF
jgi:opacity protein-like surface antigen